VDWARTCEVEWVFFLPEVLHNASSTEWKDSTQVKTVTTAAMLLFAFCSHGLVLQVIPVWATYHRGKPLRLLENTFYSSVIVLDVSEKSVVGEHSCVKCY